MYSDACHEKEYAIRLFRNLYKIYYKKEYNQLKRFRTISAAEVPSLADEPEYGVSIPGIARILSMSRIMGIKIDIDCSFLYLLLADKYVELERDADFCAAPFPEGLYEECLNQVNEWMENIKKGLCTTPEYEAYRKADSIIATVFSHNDYPSDYAFLP